MKLANMVDLGSAGSNTLQVQVLPIINFIKNILRFLILINKGSA